MYRTVKLIVNSSAVNPRLSVDKPYLFLPIPTGKCFNLLLTPCFLPYLKMDRRRPRRKRFVTIPEALQQVSTLESKCARSPDLYPVTPSDLASSYKSLISLCNSLAIVFLQYDLTREALDLLKKASTADLQLYKSGSLLDRLWQGRVTTYNSLAYLFQK